MDIDTILQELPSCTSTEPFRRSSRPSRLYITESNTAVAQNVHSVMRQLEQIFAPHETCISSLQDVVLLSLDLEYDSQKISQIGISTLDVKQLKDSPQSTPGLISSDLYLLQRNAIRVDKCQYRYGEAKIAKHSSIQDILSPFLVRSRKFVLIGHALHQDIRALKRSGFDIAEESNITSLIDLAPVASYFLNDSIRHLPLKLICRRLGIRTCGFHNAGHDALYTLQALLLLFCRYKSQKEEAVDLWSGILHLPDGSVPEKSEEETLLKAVKRIGDQAGNLLWTGSPKQRKKQAQKLQADSKR